jgi:transcriptional regulator with PAS, ATPase and Fis domain
MRVLDKSKIESIGDIYKIKIKIRVILNKYF